jgi:multidrug resistance efflux pump
MIHNTLVQDPSMGVMYGPQQKHAQLDMIYDLLGISDTTNLLLPPGSPEYQQAQAQQAQQAQMAQQKQDALLQTQLETAQTQIQTARSSDQRAWADLQWKRTDDMADNLLNEEKHSWDVERETQELQIEREQKRPVSAT